MNNDIYTVYVGHGGIKVLVLSQILPTWHESQEFFNSCFSELKNECTFQIVDSLSFVSNSNSLEEYAKLFEEILINSEAQVVIGFSFGGVILQHLSKESLSSITKVIFISTPVGLSKDLEEKLQLFVDYLKEDKTNEALLLLNSYLHSEEVSLTDVSISLQNMVDIKMRLLIGFGLLLNHRLSTKTWDIDSPILSFYGKDSKLVSIADSLNAKGICNYLVDNAGMRVLTDQKTLVSKAILDFIQS